MSRRPATFAAAGRSISSRALQNAAREAVTK